MHLKQRVGAGMYSLVLKDWNPMYTRVGTTVPGAKSSFTTDVGILTLSFILRIRATFSGVQDSCSLRQVSISSSDSADGTPLITFCTYLPLCRTTSRGSDTLML